MDPFVSMAKESITACITAKKVLPAPTPLPKSFAQRAGVFVSLHTKSDRSLRGCIGTFAPTRKNIAEEIIHNAIAAATDDPRFDPVRPDELDDLIINVDILTPPEPVTDIKQLNPVKYGLIVANQHGRKGLLLPDIGIGTIDEQIAVCCEKGGINPTTDKLSFSKFTVVRHK